MSPPAITVLMPVWNAGPFLGVAIGSVLDQTWRDFEFLVVDDGSADGSLRLAEDAAARDARIRVLSQGRNTGLRAALNRGLEEARGRYVARQDADDASFPDRLARQMQVLDADSGLAILGSAFEEIREDGSPVGLQSLPLSDTAIRWRMLFDSPFCHTSVLFRRCVDGVPVRYESLFCEDYELWVRMLRAGRGRNLSEPLVRRRTHDATYTVRQATAQQRRRAEIARAEIRRVAPELSVNDEQLERLRRWYHELPAILGPADLDLCRSVVRLLSAFGRMGRVDPREARAIRRAWYARILAATPDHRWRLACRMGVIPAMLPGEPGLVLADLARRIRARRRRP